jgi:ubiquinone/menaquinone biosynthesis C-methylase UbiE
MSDHVHWQLNGSAPELYQRYLVPAITSIWADDLVDRTQPKPGDAVLDIACGTGVVTRLVAERMVTGRIAGLDFNPGMLAVARSLPSKGASIEWFEGSALNLPFSDNSFNIVLCQLGLQFFPDRPLAIREMKRVLTPWGRVALSVYSAIENTPAAYAFVGALDRRLGSDASKIKRAEHAFPRAAEIEALMAAEGFEQVRTSTISKHITFPSVFDYVRFQLVATPMAGLLGDRNDHEREIVIKEVAAETQSRLGPEMLQDGRLTFPQEAHVATAARGA